MMIFILVHKCKRPRLMRHPKVTKVPRLFQIAFCAFCSGSIVPSFVKSNAFLGINTGVPGGSLGKMEKMKVFEKQPFCQEDWSHRWHGFIELSFERCEKSTVYLWVTFVTWMDPNQIRIDRRELVLMHFFFHTNKIPEIFWKKVKPILLCFSFGVKPSQCGGFHRRGFLGEETSSPLVTVVMSEKPWSNLLSGCPTSAGVDRL